MDNPVQEIIEEKLLKLLGLESEFEISYEEYIRHLREAMAASRMNDSLFSSEEAERITKEWKRVKNKKGRFQIKVKKTGVNTKTAKAINFISPKKQTVPQTPTTAPIGETTGNGTADESLFQIVSDIRTTVDNIYNSILNLATSTSRNFEISRRRGESGRRQQREEGLEGKIKKIGGMISKILTPVQGILDKIFRFIAFTLLGKAVGAFFKWMEDPENKKKFKSLMRFFVDHWPLFVGAFVLFGTSFGSFVRGMLKAVAKGLISLAFQIPKIKKFLKKNPKLAMLGLGVATLGTGLIANTLNPPEAKTSGDELKDVGKSDFNKATEDAKIASNSKVPNFKMGGNLSDINDKSLNPKSTDSSNVKLPTHKMGGILQNTNLRINASGSNQKSKNSSVKLPTHKMGGILQKISLHVNGGSSNKKSMKIVDGLVGNNGIPFSGGGKDDKLFPTASGGAVGLNGDEFIINKGGVDFAGTPFLESINKIGAGAGANKPKMISSSNLKINGRSEGGDLNIRAFSNGGPLSSNTSNTSNINTSNTSNTLNRFGISNASNASNASNSSTTSNLSNISNISNILNRFGISNTYNPSTISNSSNASNSSTTSNTSNTSNLSNNSVASNVQNNSKANNTSIFSNIQNLFQRFGSKSTRTTKPKPKNEPEYKLPEVQSALRTIKVAEGTIKSKNSYDTLFGFGTAPIRKMTVSEVINMQNTDRLPKKFGGGEVGFGRDSSGRVQSAASGAYQFMPTTLQQVMNLGVLKPNDLMTPDNQDKAAWALMKYRGVTLQSLKSGGLSRPTMDLMSPEWASFPTLSGESFYGQPVKKHEDLQKIYNESLKQYKSKTTSPSLSAKGQINPIELSQLIASTSIGGNKFENNISQLTVGDRNKVSPPGTPVIAKMKTIMLPEITLPSQGSESNPTNGMGLEDNDMRTSPYSSSASSTRSGVMEMLGIA